MEPALKNRLTYGPLMLLALCLLLWLDHAAEGWTRGCVNGVNGVHGIGGLGLLVLLLIILPPATVELATLFAAEKVRPYRLLSAVGAGSLVLHAFMTQWHWFQ